MANYKELEGFGVQTLATDPDSAGWVGSIFYNSTSGTFKTVKPGGIAVATWASGANLLSPTSQNAASGASTTSGLNFGGTNTYPPGPAVQVATTQTYNGSSWTEVNDLNTARRYIQGSGTQTSSLAYGGFTSPTGYLADTESWNGSCWSAVNPLNTARGEASGFGLSSTSAFLAQAIDNPSGIPASEQWNGSSWTTVASQNTPRIRYAASGAATDGIISFGEVYPAGSNSNAAETWNGSSWTTVASGNTARLYVGASGGSSTSALGFGGGTPGGVGNTEYYNGSSWTEVNDLSTVRVLFTGSGHSTSSGLAVGGFYPASLSISNATEEWTVPDVVINTLTTS